IEISPAGVLQLKPRALIASLLESADRTLIRSLHRTAGALEEVEIAHRIGHLAAGGHDAAALGLAETTRSREPHRGPAPTLAAIAEGVAGGQGACWHERAAEQAWGGGRYEEAARHWQRSLDLDPGTADSAARWEHLAAALFRAGHLSEVPKAIES